MLEVSGVSKRYASIRALRDVSLRVRAGEVVALVGENGAGKSTLVRCIARAALPDEGTVHVDGAPIGRSPRDAIAGGVSVVWQDLALCENLDVTSNLFLGRELGRHGALARAEMRSRAGAIFRRLGVDVPDLERPIRRLSGGQRQLVAIARATLGGPRVLVLDEPTAALGLQESTTVLDVVRRLRDDGVAVLLVSHQLDEVFEVADRIVVLRHGAVVADLHRAETHPDDVVAFVTGADVDSTAGQQLRRLHSLAEQLTDADVGSILPLTVSSLSGALSIDRLAVFVVDGAPGGRRLRCAASLHLPPGLSDDLGPVDVEHDPGFLAATARAGALTVVTDLRERVDDHVARLAAAHGLSGAWAAPVSGQDGALAVIAGFTDTAAQLQPDQVQLLQLFSTMAGAAIERGRLVESLRARNRSLVGLRGVLETLAGPELLEGGMATALEALRRGVDGDAAGLFTLDDAGWTEVATATADAGRDDGAAPDVATSVLSGLRAGVVPERTYVARFSWSRGEAALACRWRAGDDVGPDAPGVVDDAANSFRLAMERQLTEAAEQAAATLHRTRRQERLLTRRLGHELRTPLTAIRGFASTLLQPDVEWPADDERRFLEIIERESGRMGRLVEQLFDESAIEAGTLRLALHACDLVAVVRSAVAVAAPGRAVALDVPDEVTVWGDRDRLQQVIVNLVTNALRHNDDAVRVAVSVEHRAGAATASVTVADDGEGMSDDAVAVLAGERTADRPPDGLGLRLVRGLVAAHGGTTEVRVGGGTTVTVRLPVDPPGAA